MNEQLLKYLYDKYNLSNAGAFDQFKNDMAHPDVRKSFFTKYGLETKGSFQQFENDLYSTSLEAHQIAFLDSIADVESGGQYDVIVGDPAKKKHSITDYSKHPEIVGVVTENGPSTAAGKYQITASTWRSLQKRHGFTDFSPANQDLAAWTLAQEDYKRRSGRDLDEDLRSNDPVVIDNVRRKLQGTWEGLIGDNDFSERYASKLGQALVDPKGSALQPILPGDVTMDGDIDSGLVTKAELDELYVKSGNDPNVPYKAHISRKKGIFGIEADHTYNIKFNDNDPIDFQHKDAGFSDQLGNVLSEGAKHIQAGIADMIGLVSGAVVDTYEMFAEGDYRLDKTFDYGKTEVGEQLRNAGKYYTTDSEEYKKLKEESAKAEEEGDMMKQFSVYADKLFTPEYWAEEGSQGVGSMLSFLLPGIAANKIASAKKLVGGLSNVFGKRFGKIIAEQGVGASVNAAAESAQIASQQYEDYLAYAQEQGLSEEEAITTASNLAAESFGLNYVPLMLSNMVELTAFAGKLSKAPGVKRFFTNTGGAMLGEGGEELYQFGTEQYSSRYKDFDFDPSTVGLFKNPGEAFGGSIEAAIDGLMEGKAEAVGSVFLGGLLGGGATTPGAAKATYDYYKIEKPLAKEIHSILADSPSDFYKKNEDGSPVLQDGKPVIDGQKYYSHIKALSKINANDELIEQADKLENSEAVKFLMANKVSALLYSDLAKGSGPEAINNAFDQALNKKTFKESDLSKHMTYDEYKTFKDDVVSTSQENYDNIFGSPKFKKQFPEFKEQLYFNLVQQDLLNKEINTVDSKISNLDKKRNSLEESELKDLEIKKEKLEKFKKALENSFNKITSKKKEDNKTTATETTVQETKKKISQQKSPEEIIQTSSNPKIAAEVMDEEVLKELNNRLDAATTTEEFTQLSQVFPQHRGVIEESYRKKLESQRKNSDGSVKVIKSSQDFRGRYGQENEILREHESKILNNFKQLLTSKENFEEQVANFERKKADPTFEFEVLPEFAGLGAHILKGGNVDSYFTLEALEDNNQDPLFQEAIDNYNGVKKPTPTRQDPNVFKELNEGLDAKVPLERYPELRKRLEEKIATHNIPPDQAKKLRAKLTKKENALKKAKEKLEKENSKKPAAKAKEELPEIEDEVEEVLPDTPIYTSDLQLASPLIIDSNKSDKVNGVKAFSHREIEVYSKEGDLLTTVTAPSELELSWSNSKYNEVFTELQRLLGNKFTIPEDAYFKIARAPALYSTSPLEQDLALKLTNSLVPGDVVYYEGYTEGKFNTKENFIVNIVVYEQDGKIVSKSDTARKVIIGILRDYNNNVSETPEETSQKRVIRTELFKQASKGGVYSIETKVRGVVKHPNTVLGKQRELTIEEIDNNEFYVVITNFDEKSNVENFRFRNSNKKITFNKRQLGKLFMFIPAYNKHGNSDPLAVELETKTLNEVPKLKEKLINTLNDVLLEKNPEKRKLLAENAWMSNVASSEGIIRFRTFDSEFDAASYRRNPLSGELFEKNKNPRGGIGPIIVYFDKPFVKDGVKYPPGFMTKIDKELKVGLTAEKVIDLYGDRRVQVPTKLKYIKALLAEHPNVISTDLDLNSITRNPKVYLDSIPSEVTPLQQEEALKNSSTDVAYTLDLITGEFTEVKKEEPKKEDSSPLGDLDFRLTDPVSKKEEGDAKQYIKSRLEEFGVIVSDASINILSEIYNLGGHKIWGAFHKAVVTLSSDAGTKTGKHEAFHIVFNAMLSPEQQKAVLKEGFKKYGKKLGITKQEFEQWLNKPLEETSKLKVEDYDIKPAVAELFESNPELANAVYEALIGKPEQGKTRLWRVGSEKDDTGIWFTDSIEDLSFYLKERENPILYYVDVTKDELTKARAEGPGIGDNEFQFISEKGNKLSEGRIKQITPQQKQQAQQLYSQYLDNIFPDSKVKDIVYHGTDVNREQLSSIANRLKTRLNISQEGSDGFGYVLGLFDNKLERIGKIVYRNKTYLKNKGFPNVNELHLGFEEKYQGKGYFQDALIELLQYDGSPIYISDGRVINDNVFKAINKLDTSKLNINKIEDGYIITLNKEYVYDKTGGEEGIYFTNLKERAEYYSDWRSGFNISAEVNGTNKVPNYIVYAALLDIKSPSKGDEIKNKATISISDRSKLKGDGLVYDTSIQNGKQEVEYVVFEPEQIHILGNKQDIEGFKEFVSKQNQNIEGEYNKVSYVLKAVDILQSDKAKQVFEKGRKNLWSLDKILTELGISKEQKQLLLDLGISDREQIVLELANKYSYSIEINTANITKINSNVTRQVNSTTGAIQYVLKDEDGNLINNIKYTSEEDARNAYNTPTQIYSNLTVPGGTNYTENEIATPLITPSIKGHAEFATDKGIGWFRSDDKVKVLKRTEQVISIKDVPNNFYFEQVSPFDQSVTKVQVNKTDIGWEFIVNNKDKYDKKEFEVINAYNNYYRAGYSNENVKEPKTRRILEVQSDYFQKLRNRFEFNGKIYKIDIDSKTKEKVYLSLDKSGEFDKRYSASEYNKIFENFIDEGGDNQFLALLHKGDNWVTFFVKSIIQDSAKKGYEKVLFPSGNTASKIEGHTTLEEFKKQKEDRLKILENRKELLKQKLENLDKNNFSLEFPNFDNESDVRNYEFDAKENVYFVTDYNDPTTSLGEVSKEEGEKYFEKLKEIIKGEDETNYDIEINQLKQELERVETEGFGALKPIFNFYENTVTNILNKTYGKENVKQITDEYGNTWSEIILDSKRDLQSVKLKSEDISFYKSQNPLTRIEEAIAEDFEMFSKDNLGFVSEEFKTKYPKLAKFFNTLYKFMYDVYQRLNAAFFDPMTIEDIFYQLDANYIGRGLSGKRKTEYANRILEYKINSSSSNDTNFRIESLKPLELARYVNYLTTSVFNIALGNFEANIVDGKIIPKYKNFADLPKSKRLEFNRFYFDKIISILDIHLPKTPEAQIAKEKIIFTLKNERDLFVRYILQSIKEKYDADFRIAEEAEENEQEEKTLLFKQENVDPLTSVKNRIKGYLNIIPIRKLTRVNGNIAYTNVLDEELGVKVYYDFGTVYNKMLDLFSNSGDEKEFYNRILSASYAHDWASTVYDTFKQELIEQGLELNLNNAHKSRLFRDLYRVAGGKRNINVINTHITSGEKSRVTVYQSGKRNWVGNMISAGADFWESVPHDAEDFKKLIPKERERLSIENLITYANLLGVDISEGGARSITNDVNLLVNVENILEKHAKAIEQGGNPFLFEEPIGSKINKDHLAKNTKRLFKIISEHDPSAKTLMVHTVKNENKYSHQNNNFLTSIIDRLRNEGSRERERSRKTLLKSFEKFLIHKSLRIYDIINNGSIEIFEDSGMKVGSQKEGTEYKEFTPTEYRIHALNNFIDQINKRAEDESGMFKIPLPIFSDATTHYFANVPTIVDHLEGLIDVGIAELERIVYSTENTTGFKNFDINGKHFLILPFLNSYKEKLLKLYSEDSIENHLNRSGLGTSLKVTLRRYINDYLNKRANEYYDRLFKDGILSHVQHTEDSIPKAVKEEIRREAAEQFRPGTNEFVQLYKDLIKDYIISNPTTVSHPLVDARLTNSLMSSEGIVSQFFKARYFWNTQFLVLVAGDPAFYGNYKLEDYEKFLAGEEIFNSSKVGTDLLKRFKEGHSPKEDFILVDLDNNKLDTVKSIHFWDVVQETDTELLNELKQIYPGLKWGAHNITDAQGINSIDFTMNLLHSWGEFDKDGIRIDTLKKQKEKLKTGQRTRLTLDVIKPFTYNMIEDGQLLYPMSYKESQYTLTPAMAWLGKNNKVIFPDGKNWNEFKRPKLAKLLWILEGAGDPKRKIDCIKFDSAVKTDHNVNTFMKTDLVDNLDLETIYSKVYETPSAGLGRQQVVPRGKHLDKKLKQGSQERVLILADIPEDAIINVNGKDYTKYELINLYHDILIANTIELRKNVKEKVKDEKTLANSLKEESINRGRDIEYQMGLELHPDGRPIIPISSPNSSNESEKFINSIYKRAITPSVSGGTFVNASSYGYSDKLKIKTIKKDGKPVAIDYVEVAIPAHNSALAMLADHKGVININKLKAVYGKEVIDKLFEGFGYRIPTEDKYSMYNIKIKYILPGYSDALIILPAEATTISGLDFDVDKLFVMFRTFNIKKGNFKVFTKFVNEFLLENGFVGEDGKQKILTEEQSKELFNKQLSGEKGDTSVEQEILDYILDHFNSLRNLIKIEELEYVAPSMDNVKSRHNLMMDITASISRMPHFAQTFLEGGNSDMLDAQIERLTKVYGEPNSGIPIDISDPEYQDYNAQKATVGGRIIGIAASHVKHHVSLQVLDEKDLTLSRPLNFFNGNKYSSFVEKTKKGGSRILKSLASILFASTEHIKSPKMDRLGITDKNVSTILTGLRLGIPFEDLVLTIYHPAVRRVFDELSTIGFVTPIAFLKIVSYNYKLESEKDVAKFLALSDKKINSEEVEMSINNKNNDVEKIILSKLYRLFTATSELTGTQIAGKFDTDDAYGPSIFHNIESVMKIKNIHEKINEGKYKELRGQENILPLIHRPTKGKYKIIKPSKLRVNDNYIQIIIDQLNDLQHVFGFLGAEYHEASDELLQILDRIERPFTATELKTIFSNFTLALAQYSLNVSPKWLEEVTEKVAKIIGSRSKKSNEFYKKYGELFSLLKISKVGNVRVVEKAIGDRVDKTTTRIIKGKWAQMMNDSDPKVAQLARDLAIYSYYTSDFSFKHSSFWQFVPIDFWDGTPEGNNLRGIFNGLTDIQNTLKNLGNTKDSYEQKLKDLSLKILYNNPTLAPRILPKEFAIVTKKNVIDTKARSYNPGEFVNKTISVAIELIPNDSASNKFTNEDVPFPYLYVNYEFEGKTVPMLYQYSKGVYRAVNLPSNPNLFKVYSNETNSYHPIVNKTISEQESKDEFLSDKLVQPDNIITDFTAMYASKGAKQSGFDKKDIDKFNNKINKLISRGSAYSSSEGYAKEFNEKGYPVNKISGYKPTDIVGISAEGTREGRVPPNLHVITLAAQSGVTFITDPSPTEYNIGEKEVHDHLTSIGYINDGTGVWTKGGTPVNNVKTEEVNIKEAIEKADFKNAIEQNFFHKYRPNADLSKVHTFRKEIIDKYGTKVSTFDLVKEKVRTRTSRTSSWMKENDPKVGDYFWQINKKNPKDKILTRITSVYDREDPRFKNNWYKEGWDDNTFKLVEKGLSHAIEFEVIDIKTEEVKPEIKPEVKGLEQVKLKKQEEGEPPITIVATKIPLKHDGTDILVYRTPGGVIVDENVERIQDEQIINKAVFKYEYVTKAAKTYSYEGVLHALLSDGRVVNSEGVHVKDSTIIKAVTDNAKKPC